MLIDNGRSNMREDPVLHEALYCIRCSACLNSCANFETVGGHAFGGETYSGGIGGSWEAGTGKLMNARFSELCTALLALRPQCPVRIDIPWLNENLRQRMNQAAVFVDSEVGIRSDDGQRAGRSQCAAAEAVLRQLSQTLAKWGHAFGVAGQ